MAEKRIFPAVDIYKSGTRREDLLLTEEEKTALYKQPSLKGTKLATIPKKAKITCISRTYVTASKKVYHVTYKKGSKTYTGYIAGNTRLY